MTIDPSMRLKPGPKSGKGGRPSKGEPLEVVIRISHDLKEIVELESRPNERTGDTLLRLVRERNFAIQELQINK
jgi:hypothetical protein